MSHAVKLIFPRSVRDYCYTLYNYTDEDMERRFIGRAQTTVNELYPELHDKTINVMLDIGCGIGGTTAAVATALQVREVHLIEGEADRSAIERYTEKQLQFTHTISPWNDVSISGQMVKANVPNHVAVFGHRWGSLHPMDFPKFDLVTSFRSWCHHYPVATYIEFVKDRLHSRGYLVVDVRHGTDGEDQLSDHGFRTIAWVSQASASPGKTKRLILQKV